MEIFNSPSKVVFIFMAVALVSLTFLGTVSADSFVQLCSMAFVFYFAKPPTPSVTTTTNDSATVSTGMVEK